MGYWLSKGLKFNEKTARTVSIETGKTIVACRKPGPLWEQQSCFQRTAHVVCVVLLQTAIS